MTTAAIYTRVSRDEQAYNYSLTTQLEACQKWAIERGYTVVQDFPEDYTGTLLDRPELDKVRALARRQAIDVLIVHDLDRLARSMIHQMMLEEELKHLGVTVEYVLANYEDTPEGRFQKQVRAAVAELEREKILERMKRGKKGRAKAGYINPSSGGRYGFVYRHEEHKGWFEHNAEEADVVRTIYKWYTEGDENGQKLGIEAIAKRLTADGIPSPDDDTRYTKKRARGSWHNSVVQSILSDEVYCGTCWYNRRHGKELRPREEWIAVPVPPIVSRETWEAARAQAQANRTNAKRNSRHEYLMRGRLCCAQCGRLFRASSRGKNGALYQYYRCGGQDARYSEDHTTLSCHGYMSAKLIDMVVWDYLREYLRDPERVRAGVQEKQSDRSTELETLQMRLDDNRRRIEKLTAARKSLLDLFAEASIPREELMEKVAEKNNLIQKAQAEIDATEARLKATKVDPESAQRIEQMVREIQDKLATNQLSFATKRAIVDILDVTAVVIRGEAENDIEISSIALPITRLSFTSDPLQWRE